MIRVYERQNNIFSYEMNKHFSLDTSSQVDYDWCQWQVWEDAEVIVIKENTHHAITDVGLIASQSIKVEQSYISTIVSQIFRSL